MENSIQTIEHQGGVVSRTAGHFTVQEPVEVTIAGQEVGLSLDDAKDLLAGLKEAVETVEASQAGVAARNNGHTFVLGKTRYGMSMVVPSKLGKHPDKIDKSRLDARSNGSWVGTSKQGEK